MPEKKSLNADDVEVEGFMRVSPDFHIEDEDPDDSPFDITVHHGGKTIHV